MGCRDTRWKRAIPTIMNAKKPDDFWPKRLNWTKARYQICFQSRFGRAEWLTPYTAVTLEQLGRQGTRRVDVVCPGFVSDCLETLEEIAMEGKAIFMQAGGQEFHYIPCLNERGDWIQALADITLANLQGWLGPEQPDEKMEQARSITRRVRFQRESGNNGGNPASNFIGLITKPAAHELNCARKNGKDNYAENEKGQIVFHHRHITEKESPEYEETDPENAAERTVRHEAGINHAPDTGNEWCKGANDGQKACKDDRLAAMLFIKLMSFLQMSAIQ